MVDIPILAKVDDMQKVEDIHMIVAHMSMQRIMQKVSAPQYHLPELRGRDYTPEKYALHVTGQAA